MHITVLFWRRSELLILTSYFCLTADRSTPAGVMVTLVFACARSRTRYRRIRHRGSERLRLGEIRCRGALIAEHELNFGAIPIGEHGICSECDTAVEVIPRAVQIAEPSTRATALIENVRVVWIERDQRVEIDNLHTCVGTKPIRGRKFRIELDRLTEL